MRLSYKKSIKYDYQCKIVYKTKNMKISNIFHGNEWFSMRLGKEWNMTFWNVIPYNNRLKADEKSCKKNF